MGFPSKFVAQWPAPEYTPVLFGAICLAGLGTIALFCIGLIAFFRRPSRRYLLVVIALGMLVLRTGIGLGTVFGIVPMTIHHLLEHGLDFLISMLIFSAIYLSETNTPQTMKSEPD